MDISVWIERSKPPDNITTCFKKLSLIDSNSSIGRPGREMTREENILLSNDPSFGLVRPKRLVAFGCSTLYLFGFHGLLDEPL
jgi:hypothetical protein